MGSKLHLDEMGTSLTNGRRGLTTGVGQVKMSSHHRGTQHNNEWKGSTFCSQFTGSDSRVENEKEHPTPSLGKQRYTNNTGLTGLERAT